MEGRMHDRVLEELCSERIAQFAYREAARVPHERMFSIAASYLKDNAISFK
jgi:hypothetical protein